MGSGCAAWRGQAASLRTHVAIEHDPCAPRTGVLQLADIPAAVREPGEQRDLQEKFVVSWEENACSYAIAPSAGELDNTVTSQ